MQVLDVLLVITVATFVVRGAVIGVSGQLPTVLGALAGVALGLGLAPAVAGAATSPTTQGVVVVVVVLAPALALGILGASIGRHLSAVVAGHGWRPLDAVAGALFSAGLAVVGLWALLGPVQAARDAGVADLEQSSAILHALSGVVAPPEPLTDSFRGLIDNAGLTARGPVDAPAAPLVAVATASGERSTVRITGQACAMSVEGSGAVVGPELVATNAHVVAGQEHPSVDWRGQRREGTVVVFDADDDLALLRVPGLPAPAFALATDVARGAEGAVLGFPEGGPFTATGAAVRGRFNGAVPDLAGGSRVRRDVLELQASVRPGGSGGPFVLPDGRLGGLVFGRSLDDKNVGYAVPSATLARLLPLAQGVEGAADTGPCLNP